MRRSLVLVVAASLLGGCGTDGAIGPERGNPMVVPTLVSSAPEAGAVDDGTTPATADPEWISSTRWVIDFAGLGPARIGMVADQFAEALGTQLVADGDGTSDNACRQLALGTRGSGVLVLAPGGPQGAVSRVEVNTRVGLAEDRTSLPRTAAGIGVGSTLDQVRQAYPRSVVTSHTYIAGGNYVRVANSDGRAMVFETDETRRVVVIRAGLSGPVDLVDGCL